MAQQDPKLQSMQYKTVVFAPKLRKNRKIELRWGNKYYESVKNAVFSTQFTPYMPAEPPQTIREEIDKTGYVCKQCRDCFRFLSSIEEHTSRRSWVLGFWCQQCFVTTCTHKAQGKSNCSNCIDTETAKHDYLLSKGIKKNLKKGVTRIFYNQCQFFAHLRMHGINIVDLSELMLMPLPCGIEQEHYAQLDKIWKALIEAMFIRRMHIMDWIRDKKICWKDVLSHSKEADLVADIVKSYAEDCIGPLDKSESSRQDNPIQFEDSRRIARNLGSHGTSSQLKKSSGDARRNNIHIISSKTRNNSDKFVSNDIAFVDCGPTPNNCIAESPGLNFPDRSVESPEKVTNTIDKQSPLVDKKFDHEPPLWPSFTRKYEKLREKSRDESQKNQKLPEDRTETSSLSSINRTGPRVLTIRSPRSLSISTIMKHLPTDAPNNKKLVVVTEDGKTGNGLSGSAESLVSKKDRVETIKTAVVESKTLTPIAPKNDVKSKPLTKTKINAPTNILINHKDNPTLAPNAVAQTFSEQMSLHGKIVFQNGRKYIIRHVPKAKYQSIVQDTLVAKNFRNPPPLSMPVSVAKRLLLPKPPNVPVKVSVPLRKSIVIKQPPQIPKILPKLTNPAGLSLVSLTTKSLSQNNKPKITKMHKSIIARIRESMHNELQKATKNELEAYTKNLKEINEMYTKAIGFDGNFAVFSNLNTIERFEKLTASAPAAKSIKEEPDEALIEDASEKSAKEWELNMKSSDKKICTTCGKKTKPSAYIIGMSGPATDESIYCQCYNSICFICNTNQGNFIQLMAHIKWHKGKKPFSCPDCSLGYKSAKDLEIHSWTTCFHPISRHIYGCSVCEIEGILDMETVAKHFLLIHTRRKIICSECKMEFPGNSISESDYKQHNAIHHKDVPFISEPKQLFLCNLKQCVVRPELFRTHLSDHIGVLSWIYYKCPFCSMATQGTIRNKAMIREHLVENHLDRLHEVVSAESLPDVLQGIQFPPSSSAAATQTTIENLKKVSQVTNANTSGPMIINARSITPASFHRGSDISQEQIEDSMLPKILDVRSEATDEFETSDLTENDYNMQIITVESVTEKRSESPETKSENSDTISQESISDELASLGDENVAIAEMYTSPVQNNIDDENFDSNDNINSELTCSPPKLERKPSCSFDITDETQEWNISENYKNEFLTISESDKNARRPWRIALNSPSSVETSPVAYNCHVCGELINTSWSVIKNHFNTHHANDYELSVVSPQIPQITSGYIDGGYRKDCHIRKRKSEGSITPGGKRRKRWGPKKYFEKPGSPSLGLCVRPEPVQEVEGSFRCKKCDQLFDEISMMREHIATKHRIKGQYLICLECGENFVVVPSLQMHLKALHGIQDPITYLTQNTAYAPDTPEDTDEEERTAESNQCYVCMAVFEDKAAVDKHIRVHGMAFLKRKRFEAQKAQKCVIKKPEPPDNINTSVSPEKLKIEEEASKVSVKTDETMENAGSSDDKLTNVQKPLKFWVKKFDSIDSFNTSKINDDKSHDAPEHTLETQDNDVSLLGANATSLKL